MNTKKMGKDDLLAAARKLGVPVAAVQAILDVEAPRGGFEANGEVVILFEPHKFSEYTKGKFDRSHPDLSNPRWGAIPYGTYASQHPKLRRAAALDRDAALRATSWGIPQVLGNNWKKVGATSLQDFINKMSRSEASQLDLMVAFILSDAELLAALRARDWHTVARKYNGTRYRENQYHTKLATAYRANGGT